MSNHDYDLFVIGGGSGGVRAARVASLKGAKVALAEQSHLGGTCVNVGCVPKKFFSYAAEFASGFEQSKGYGFSSTHTFDWATLRDNTANEIKRLNGIYQGLLEKANVTLFNAHAKVTGANQVEVDGKTVTAGRILLATGGKPRQLDFPGAECMLVSDQMFTLETLPKRLAVYGGGYIAVEFASIMHALGVETHLIYRGDLLLSGFDKEVREFVRDSLEAQGLHLHFGHSIERIEQAADHKTVLLDNGESIVVDQVLGAVGRVPNFDGLGLESVNVELDDSGLVKINDAYETSTPSLLAIGDIIDSPALTPVAIAEAMRLVTIHFDGNREGEALPPQIDYAMVATAVFCHPNVAVVGKTEEEARQAFDSIRVYTSSFRPLMHTLARDDQKCFMKLVVDDSSDRVVGAHVVGSDAGELVQGLAIAVKAGLTKADFDSTIGIHPTSAEEIVTMREPTRR